MNIPKLWQCPSCQEAVKPWKTVGVGLLVILSLAYFWNREHRSKADALREAEAARLALSQQIVASQDSAKEVQASLKDLTEQNDLLREAYEQAQKAAPDAKPESTAKLVTASVRVAQAPPVIPDDPGAHPPMPPVCDKPLVSDGHGSFTCPPDKALAPRQCVLAAGDLGSFRVDEVVLKTDQGNRLIAGTAEFWRDLPGPRAKLAAGKFSSTLSSVGVLETPPEPRWGAELAGMCARDGCGLGAGVLLPPFRVPLLGLRGEARLDAYAGPSLALAGALGARW